MLKINFRPLFIVAVSLIVGIVSLANFCLEKSLQGIVMFVLSCTFLTFSVVIIITSFFANNKLTHFCKKFKGVAICVVVGMLIALSSFSLTVKLFNSPTKEIYNDVTVCGRIDNIKKYNTFVKVLIDNIKIDEQDFLGKCEIGISKGELSEIGFEEGTVVRFKGDVTKVKASLKNVYNIVNNTKFSTNININKIEILDSNKTFKQILKQKVSANFYLALNSDNADLAYSMLFGEKDNLDSDMFYIFSFSGIAHLLAVSGLHVGFLVVLIVGGLKLIKCNKHIACVIVFLILLFYAYLTNFTPSVVRAVIMSVVLLLSKAYLKEYDTTSSLSVAAIIILALSPFSIFSVGFQLSFACVFAIITLAPLFLQCLEFIKCPKKLAQAISVSLAVNFGVFAITAHHFNTINFISVLTNLFVLPLFSVCFMILFVFGFLGAITPAFNFVMGLSNVILHFIKLIASFVTNVKFLNIRIFCMDYLIVLLILLALFIIKFLISKPRIKAILGGGLIMLAIILTIVTNIPANFSDYNLMINYSRYGNNAILTTEDNKTILVASNVTAANYLISLANKSKVGNVDAVVCFNYYYQHALEWKSALMQLNPKIVVTDDTLMNNLQFDFAQNIKFYNDVFNIYGVEFNFVKNNTSVIGLEVKINKKNLLFVSDNIASSDCYYFNKQYDYAISNNNNIDFSNFGVDYKNLITYRGKVLSLANLNDVVFFTKTI